MEHAEAVEAMIDGQLRPSEVNDPAILSAIRAVPRTLFVPKAKRGFAYVDEDIEVAPGRALMEPMVFGRLLVAAAVKPVDTVLDIGGATGYSAAVLAQLAESVVALENDAALAEAAEQRLASLDIVNVAVVTGELTAGVEKEAPFDVIYLAGAVDEVPAVILDQLAEGGRLVCVQPASGVGRAQLYTRQTGSIGRRSLFDANIVALPGFQKATSFVF